LGGEYVMCKKKKGGGDGGLAAPQFVSAVGQGAVVCNDFCSFDSR
jgi:hypothetical protein